MRNPIPILTACLVVSLASGACAQPGEAGAYTTPIVLFVDADSAALERLRARLGEEDFYVVADDAMWYRAEAYTLLDSLQVPHATVERRPLRFRVRGTVQEYDWSEVEAEWFVVLYNGRDQPKVVAAVELPQELGFVLDPPASPTGGSP